MYAKRCTTKLHLKENMRIKAAAANAGKDISELNKFSDYLLRIGEGKEPETTGEPGFIFILEIAKNMDEMELIRSIYPNIDINATNRDFMTERAILSPLNTDVDHINQLASEYFPGVARTYLSADTVLCKSQEAKNSTEF